MQEFQPRERQGRRNYRGPEPDAKKLLSAEKLEIRPNCRLQDLESRPRNEAAATDSAAGEACAGLDNDSAGPQPPAARWQNLQPADRLVPRPPPPQPDSSTPPPVLPARHAAMPQSG